MDTIDPVIYDQTMRHAPLLIPMLGLVACLNSDLAPSSSTSATGPATANATASAKESTQDSPPPAVLKSTLALDPSKLRDPFQSLVKETPTRPFTRDATFGDTPIDSLHVRGTVTASGAGYAILADEKGSTAIVHEGRLVGAAHSVGDSGSFAQWRVDRVRQGEVVLVEEGPDGRAPRTFVLRSGSPKA